MKKFLFIAILFCLSIAAFAQDSLIYSKKQVADDIRYLLKNAADIHPNLYHDISAGELTRRVDSLISKLPDSVSLFTAYGAFAQATAFVNEGHTSLDIPSPIRKAMRAGAFKGIPLQVLSYDNNYFEANLIMPQAQVKHIEVSSINGQESSVILARMMALKGDLPSFRKVVAIGNFRFFLSVIGISQPYLIKYKDVEHVSKTVTVNSITEKEYSDALIRKPQSEPYALMITNDKYAYLNFKAMADYDRFCHFCDSVFKMLDERKISRLVVDLRENGGGNSGLGHCLLNYITDKPYRMAGDSKRKVSQQFKDYLTANKDLYGDNYNDYLKLPVGTFMPLGSDDLTKPENKEHKFKGKVCFLIGPNTFSSANMLAATVKDYKLFTLIGEPTGEAANHYGELCTIKLPNTDLRAFTSTTMWGRPNGNANDKGVIAPDYLVNAKSGTRDNVLEYAKKWLDK
ncbi:S41 family peptidase [Mucilaginibacter sp. AW1-3]